MPLPDQPPQPSDWQSADARNVNVGSGQVSADISGGLQGSSGLGGGPATGPSDVRVDSDEFGVNTTGSGVGRLGGPIPSDAVASGKQGQADAETRQPDYGYPRKNDPSSGVQS